MEYGQNDHLFELKADPRISGLQTARLFDIVFDCSNLKSLQVYALKNSVRYSAY